MAKQNSVIFDSNIWIGYFSLDDSQHQKAEGMLEKYKKHLKLVPEYVVLEVISIIKIRSGGTRAQQCLDMLQNTETIEVIESNTLFQATCTAFHNITDDHLSFVDIALMQLAKKYEVVTFDKKLAQAIATL